jgi:hypothetical protein
VTGPREEQAVSVEIRPNGHGQVRRTHYVIHEKPAARDVVGEGVIASADNIPDLVLEVWDLFHAGTITREEREQLHADIDAECGL